MNAPTGSLLQLTAAGIRFVENLAAIALLIAIVVDVSLQVVFRYVLSHPLSWSSELATYLFEWLTVLGMAIAQRERAHLAVQFFADRSPAVRDALRWLAWGVSLVFFALLLFGGYFFFAGDTIQSGPATGIPLWAVYSCLPVGAALGLYHVLYDLPRVIALRHSPQADLRPGHR